MDRFACLPLTLGVVSPLSIIALRKLHPALISRAPCQLPSLAEQERGRAIPFGGGLALGWAMAIQRHHRQCSKHFKLSDPPRKSLIEIKECSLLLLSRSV